MSKFIALLLILMACDSDNPEPKNMACVTGYNKSDPSKEIILIGCYPKEEALRGSHEIPRLQYFAALRLTYVSNCNECQ